MKYLLIGLITICFAGNLSAQTDSGFLQKELIYGRKDGMALTMFMLSPKAKANGKSIVSLISGGWYSMYDWVPFNISNSKTYIERGYTVFLVLHSSRPKYTIQEAIPDIHRAIRFVRYYARDFRIDPDHIGITGGSAGGQLSLVMATADDKIDSNAEDPVDRVSSHIQAAACFYPPTDFLNWGKTAVNPLDKTVLDKADVRAPFDFTEWDTTYKHFVLISNKTKLIRIYREISPIYHITPNDPPILIAHGDKDNTVPLEQSEMFIKKLKLAKVTCELLIKRGGGHGEWDDTEFYFKAFADWFDKYLK
jgi:dipeptidyl aminopeptidase/acylaminoacyl peptidase